MFIFGEQRSRGDTSVLQLYDRAADAVRLYDRRITTPATLDAAH
jgi:hypothetical protein